MNRVQFAVCEFCLPQKGPDACRAAAEAGLDGLSLEIGLMETELPLTEEENQRIYLESAQRYGVELCSLAVNLAGKYTLLHPDSQEEGRVVRDVLRRSVRAAANMGIPIIQMSSFFANAIRTEEDMRATAVYLREMCEMAEPHGIIIGGENTLDTQGNLELMALVNRPNYKVYFDTQNATYFDFGKPDEMLRKLGADSICQIHVKDGTQDALGSERLGQGNGRFAESMRAIQDIGYSGWIVLENEYDDLQDLAEDVRILKMYY